MSTPWLSIIAPTIGRPELARLLQSIRRQAPATEVEVLIVGDTHGGKWAVPLQPVPALCARYEARYLPHDGGQHMVGHPQRNYGQTQATGAWLLWSQDDNLYEPDALARVRKAVQHTHRPHLFRVETRFDLGYGRLVVWQERKLLEGNIDADCLCVPNEPAKLGAWTMRYEGDADFIRETCRRWDWSHRWQDQLIVRCGR